MHIFFSEVFGSIICSSIDVSLSSPHRKQNMENIFAGSPLVSLNKLNAPWRMVKGLFGCSRYIL